jgi:histidinol phosphatase-like PHP family hydrolase
MTEEFVKVASRQGVMFSIGSDAHHPRDVGNLERGARVAQAAGLRAERVLNAVEVRSDGSPKYGRDWHTTRDFLKSYMNPGSW